jgi:hypothetical protein
MNREHLQMKRDSAKGEKEMTNDEEEIKKTAYHA